MKKLSLLVLGFAFACNSSQKTVAEAQQPKPVASPVSYAESITQEDLKELIRWVSSVSLGGQSDGRLMSEVKLTWEDNKTQTLIIYQGNNEWWAESEHTRKKVKLTGNAISALYEDLPSIME